MPKLRQLRALDLIGQTGSFTRTAERLFITQSAISALIRELESEVGQSLVTRGRAVRLTPAGEHLARAGSRANHEIDRALQEVRGVSPWTESVVRVVAGSLSAATFVPRALARLARLAPGVRVVLIDRPVAMIGDLLLSGDADVALGSVSSSRVSSQLASELLFRDTLCVVCARAFAPSTALARPNRKVTWATLEGSALVLVGPSGGMWNSLLQEQIALHPAMKVAYEVQLYSTALELVRQGLGIAVLPRFAARALDRSIFVVRDLHAAGVPWTTYWVTRKAAEASRPEFVALRRAFRDAVGGTAAA